MELNISNAEMIVMRVVWSLGEAKVNDIMEQIRKRQKWSIATVKTLLGRLVKKKVLSTTKVGRCFIYRPLMSECAAVRLMSVEFLSKVCATKQSQLLKEMIESSVLTDSDRKDLIESLIKKDVVSKKVCNCLKNVDACLHTQS